MFKHLYLNNSTIVYLSTHLLHPTSNILVLCSQTLKACSKSKINTAKAMDINLVSNLRLYRVFFSTRYFRLVSLLNQIGYHDSFTNRFLNDFHPEVFFITFSWLLYNTNLSIAPPYRHSKSVKLLL